MLHRNEERLALMPFGELMDQISCYRQFYGMEKAGRNTNTEPATIDDVFPDDLI